MNQSVPAFRGGVMKRTLICLALVATSSFSMAAGADQKGRATK